MGADAINELYNLKNITGQKDIYVRFDSSALENAGKKALKANKVREDMFHLITQYRKGNTNPGIGTRPVSGTYLSELRGDSSVRVYFREKDNCLQIHGISDKKNQDRVIAELKRFYGK